MVTTGVVYSHISSKVMLHQWGRTITRDQKVSIQNTIQLLVLEEYYQQQFEWSNTVYGKIDWDISHRSINGTRTNISTGSTNILWASYQLEDVYTHNNPNTMSNVVLVGQRVTQMTTYSNDRNEYNIEMRSTKQSNN